MDNWPLGVKRTLTKTKTPISLGAFLKRRYSVLWEGKT